MPGIRTIESDLRIPAGSIVIHVDDAGRPIGVDPTPVVPQLRTDLWPYWLMEAVEAAADAKGHVTDLESTFAADSEDPRVNELLTLELRAAMRALSSAAFAIDSFYAAIKARSPEHPDQQKWHESRTSRPAQVFETLRYHLKLKNEGAKEIRSRITQVYKFRDWAVHAVSEFREPVHREDVDAGLDWHFSAFRAENAAQGVAMTVQMFDVLVAVLGRGSDELKDMQAGAKRAIDRVFDAYGSVPEGTLPDLTRAEQRIPDQSVPHAQDVSEVEGAPDCAAGVADSEQDP